MTKKDLMSECEIQISHIKSQRSNYDSAAWRSKIDDEVSRFEWFIEKLKNLDEVAVDSGEVCTCTIFHSYKERHENLCSKTGKRIF